jgi:2-amino-4-hydroxy-6-hydroxymethyldihydropteridine diphosphokinase
VAVVARRMHSEAVTAYIALGANLGDAAATLRQAVQDVGRLPHTRCTQASSLYSSAPIDSSGPDYINAVVEVFTQLTAPDLLQHLQQLEAAAGRQRPYTNAPRTLDLDVLLYGDAHIDSPELTVPHPRMWQRAFVLLPLAEIAPQHVPASALQAVEQQVIHRLV